MILDPFRKKRQRIHLDYASTTPVSSEVFKAMLSYFETGWANPSAIYKEGVEARKVIESHRTELARVLNIRPDDITFTSGGTESNNLALAGLVEALAQGGRVYADMEILTTRIEHPSILETVKYLEGKGVEIVYMPIDAEGNIEVGKVHELLSSKTVLVTFAYINSEIGVMQDVKKISRIVRKWNDEHGVHVYTHVDASQAPLWAPCMLDMLGIDMLTLDAGKCYGPKGVGVLAHRHWVPLQPLMFGGGQERGLRSGTENTALIVGGVRALVRAQKNHQDRSLAVAKLRDELIERLIQEIPYAVLNGSHANRVANNVNISIPGLDTEYAVIWLDAKGIAASTKSACGSAESTGSSVVREITHDEARATSTLRFTLGEETTKSDIEKVVQVLQGHIALMSKE